MSQGWFLFWTGLLRQQDSNTPAPYVLDVRRAAAKLLWNWTGLLEQ